MTRCLHLLILGVTLVALAGAQSAPPKGQAGGAQEAPPDDVKNVQVLKGLSHDQIVWAMGFISQSLGVTCEHCHVRTEKEFQLELDDKKEKKTARAMLLMTKAINDQRFEGQQRVTCATCHNGHPQPRPFNPIVDIETVKARFAALSQAAGRAAGATSYPSALALLTKYEQAIGGSEALSKLNTRVEKFTAVDPTGTSSGESVRKAPNKWIESNRSSTWTCDGTSARIVSPGGSRAVTGLDLEDIKFTASFWRNLKLTERYSRAETKGKESLNGHDVYIVQGEVRGSSIQEQLFLDANSGLLLRRVTYKPTALGSLADQIDFEDYRTVYGIKVPFLVRAATGAFATTRTYTEIKFNVPIDDARFSTPGDSQNRSGQ